MSPDTFSGNCVAWPSNYNLNARTTFSPSPHVLGRGSQKFKQLSPRLRNMDHCRAFCDRSSAHIGQWLTVPGSAWACTVHPTNLCLLQLSTKRSVFPSRWEGEIAIQSADVSRTRSCFVLQPQVVDYEGSYWQLSRWVLCNGWVVLHVQISRGRYFCLNQPRPSAHTTALCGCDR